LLVAVALGEPGSEPGTGARCPVALVASVDVPGTEPGTRLVVCDQAQLTLALARQGVRPRGAAHDSVREWAKGWVRHGV